MLDPMKHVTRRAAPVVTIFNLRGSFRTALATAIAAGLATSVAGAQTASGGQNLTTRTVVDHQQGDMTVETLQVPQGWTDRSAVQWDLTDMAVPATVSLALENPTTREGVFLHPPAQFFMLPQRSGNLQVGEKYHGMIFASPTPPAETLTEFARRTRTGLPNYHVVSTRDAPDLPGVRGMDPSRHPAGVVVRVAYQLNGKEVEEDFYAVHYDANVCSNTPNGQACETHWGLNGVHSFRAPTGTMDRSMPLFTTIMNSGRTNPAWLQRIAAAQNRHTQAFAANTQTHAARSAMAAQRANQIVQQSNQRIAAHDRSLLLARQQGSGASGAPGRSMQDRWDDYDRGVTTTNDPNGGTSQHDANYTYHWTDGHGSYQNSNDPSYDPNKSGNGSWTLMQESK
jgi:hypothetical protein